MIEAPAAEEPRRSGRRADRAEADAAPAEPESEELPSDVPAEEPVEPRSPSRSHEAPALEPAEASSFTTAEREAIADQPTVFFEQQPPGEIELGDLELDIDEEIEEVGGAVSSR